jgi:Tfp pilus assembly protein PilF
VNTNVRPLLLIAREHVARSDHHAAETLLREVVRQEPSNAEAHRLIGMVFHARGDLRSARESFERVLAIEPTPEVAALLAITCNELGLYADARRVAHDAAPPDSAKDPVPPYAREHLAGLHAQTARAYEKVSLFQEAAEEYRRSLVHQSGRADIRTRLGVMLRTVGDYEGARRELQRAIDNAPTYAPAFVALGLTCFRLGQHDEAAQHWRSALSVDPSLKPAQVYLNMLEHKGAHIPSVIPELHPNQDLGDLEISLLTGSEG